MARPSALWDRIMAALEARGGPMSVLELYPLGGSRNAVASALTRLKNQGRVRRVAPGIWELGYDEYDQGLTEAELDDLIAEQSKPENLPLWWAVHQERQKKRAERMGRWRVPQFCVSRRRNGGAML